MLGCGRGEGVGVLPGSQCPVGEVGLPGLVRAVGWDRMKELRGRFCGCGVMVPARFRIRQIVALDGGATVPVEVGEDRVGSRI